MRQPRFRKNGYEVCYDNNQPGRRVGKAEAAFGSGLGIKTFSYCTRKRRAMFSLTKRLGLAAMLGLAVLAVTGPKAHGQSPYFQVRPGLTLQQAAFNVAVMGQ